MPVINGASSRQSNILSCVGKNSVLYKEAIKRVMRLLSRVVEFTVPNYLVSKPPDCFPTHSLMGCKNKKLFVFVLLNF